MILSEVIAHLVTVFDAATGTVAVHDGPVPTSVNAGRFVLVGSTGEEEDGATVDFVPSELGPGIWRDEVGEIVCSAWSWSGGTNLVEQREAVLALAVQCIEAVHADRTLGGLLEGPGRADTSAIRYQPRQTESGAICRTTWLVTYQHLNT